jgi:hypothetical protein
VYKGAAVVDTIHVKASKKCTFGLHPACNMQLSHKSISRHHATIAADADCALTLEDLGSTHGCVPLEIDMRCLHTFRRGFSCSFGGGTSAHCSARVCRLRENRTKLNGTRVEPNVKLPLPPGSQVLFGASTRLYVVVEDVPPPVHDFAQGSGWDKGAVVRQQARQGRREDGQRRSRSRSREREWEWERERRGRHEGERARGGTRDDHRHSRGDDDRRREERRRSRSPPRAYRR